ncbi:two-component regulator propeller domain-containing protein [Dyella sp. A6]|uniref:two-component regulator propeller domain-containing protein n=1 Tax=Dyella aluminiiresistens TaxID=3069105 RepID=UPI002E787035|nr:two-component regulator propeller domain-containing protein [Dyella sp. A6]
MQPKSVWCAVLAVALSLGFAQATVPVASPPPAAAAVSQATHLLPTPQFRHYGEAAGIPPGAVYSVAQDRNGVMWFGAAEGLIRFDGVAFKVYQHVAGDPDSLPANQTYSLYVDHQNRIWGGGDSSGLFSYDQRTHRFRSWVHDSADPHSLASNEVWSIAQTRDGTVWVATQHGLDRLRPDERGFDRVVLSGGRAMAADDPNRLAVRALLADAHGRLWIGAASGLFVREANGHIHPVPVAPGFHGNLGKVWRIQGYDGEIRVATNDGLLLIGHDGIARAFNDGRLSALDASVTSSVRDAGGRLWIGSAKGILLDDGTGPLQTIASHPLLPGGLPSARVWQIMRDNEGGLWFALDQGGIAYLPPHWNGFTRFTHIPDDPDSLTGISALTVHATSEGKLLVAGFTGWIDELDVATGKVRHLEHALHGDITSITRDAQGRLWLTEGGAVFVLEHGKPHKLDIASAHMTRPVFIRAAGDGKVYVASWGEGIFAIDPHTLSITQVPLPKGIANVALANQLTTHDGQLWLGGGGGLLRLDEAAGRMVMVAGVPHAEIVAFTFDKGGFWAVSGTTLAHYRYARGVAIRDQSIDVSRYAFLPNLQAIREDRQGNLWLFANPGLWRMDAHTHEFASFGVAQGLPNTDFTNGSTAMLPDGTMFAANSGGVVAFRPDRLQLHLPHQAPKLTLGSVSVNDQGRVRQLSITPGQPLKISWRDRDLRVQVRLASYVEPPANDYRFRLTGFDANWVDVGNRGERAFSGLRAGDYALRIKARGANGVWSHLATPLRIHVQSPPWLRWWAWLVYLGLLALLVAGVLLAWRRRMAHRHQIQLAEQRRTLAEHASAAKSQFLATLSHEIRTPMTGVMGMAELLLATPQTPQQREYTEAMQRSGGLLLKLVNDALDLARIEAGKLELEPVPFDPRALADDVVRLESAQAQAKGLTLNMQLDDCLPARLVGDAVRIKQVLFNLINNALKFTRQGAVTLAVRWQDDALMCIVSDTGPGIPAESQVRLFERFEQNDGPQRRSGSGLGLAICRELVALMQGTITLHSRLGQGSTFTVRLPLSVARPAAMEDGRRTALVTPFEPGLDVLLVEDDAIVAAVIRGMLEQQGHRVRYAANGLQALTELDVGPCDVVLLDLDLPRIDGLQLARLIRQGRHARTWIVAITARSGGDEEARSRAVGMDGFLRKPLTGAQLAEALVAVPRAPVQEVADTV